MGEAGPRQSRLLPSHEKEDRQGHWASVPSFLPKQSHTPFPLPDPQGTMASNPGWRQHLTPVTSVPKLGVPGGCLWVPRQAGVWEESCLRVGAQGQRPPGQPPKVPWSLPGSGSPVATLLLTHSEPRWSPPTPGQVDPRLR